MMVSKRFEHEIASSKYRKVVPAEGIAIAQPFVTRIRKSIGVHIPERVDVLISHVPNRWRIEEGVDVSAEYRLLYCPDDNIDIVTWVGQEVIEDTNAWREARYIHLKNISTSDLLAEIEARKVIHYTGGRPVVVGGTE